jgi:drug/metabolite transporter (DMT)-like permease
MASSPNPPAGAIPPRTWTELCLLAAIWGASFLSISIALREMGPLTAVLHRVFWAALLLWPVVWLRGGRFPRDRESWIAFGVMGLLNNAIPFTLMAWGQTHIETGLVSIFNASTAIFGALVAASLLPEERLTRARALGVALGFAGVVAIIGADALRGLDIRSLAQGAVTLGAFSYALASVWARRRLAGRPPELAAAGMLTASTLIMAPLALISEGAPPLHLSPATWAAITWYAALGTAFAYLLYYRIIARAGAANTMLVTLMIPPVSIALGAVILGERIGPAAAVGYGLVALGLVIIDGRAVAALYRRRVRA